MAATESGNRIDVLAQPKQAPFFVADRRSVYWVDKVPPTPGSGGTTPFTVNAWQDALAKPKNTHPLWQEIHRPNPIWQVGEGARSAEASARVAELASHKNLHQSYQFERSVYTEVPPGAQSAAASGRVQALSQQKPHLVWPSHDTLRDGPFNHPITTVSAPAMRSRATDRVHQLAESKDACGAYRPPKSVLWPVGDRAMNAVATLRLQQLARPKSARLRKDDFDPYKVTIGARNARPTPRVTELCEPIPRKIRQKKVF